MKYLLRNFKLRVMFVSCDTSCHAHIHGCESNISFNSYANIYIYIYYNNSNIFLLYALISVNSSNSRMIMIIVIEYIE